MKLLKYGTVLITFILITGCAANNNASEPRNDNQNLVHVKSPGDQNREEKSNQEIAKHLANLASRVPNVNDATAVVAGPYAVVGIDVNNELDRSKVGSIKYSVAESLKHDPYGAYAVVVADPDTFKRLQEMGKQIQNGHPLGGIMDELAAIVGRIMPQVPSDMPNNTKKPTEQNEDQMQGGQKKLDQIQNDQSNHQLNNQ